MVTGIITIALILAVYYITQKLWLTVVIAIAIIFIMRSLDPYIKLLTDKLFPRPKITSDIELDMEGDPGRGMRMLVVTQDVAFDRKLNDSAELMDKIIEGCVKELREKHPIFALRYDEVYKRRLPIQICSAICGEKNSGMRSCVRAWIEHIGNKDFAMQKKDSELFIYDGQFNDPVTGELKSSAVLILFDSGLPKTIRAEPIGEQ